MAEHEYYEVNGRQIRVRPTESGQEIDEYGNFHRQPNHFTKGFGEGENPVEADRYILFWGKGCNWSNRASIARELLGLDKAIKVEIVDWGDYEKPLGWEFVNSPDHINKETGAQIMIICGLMQETCIRHRDSGIRQILRQSKNIITLTAILEIFIRSLQRDRMKKRGCFHMEERSFQKNKI